MDTPAAVEGADDTNTKPTTGPDLPCLRESQEVVVATTAPDVRLHPPAAHVIDVGPPRKPASLPKVGDVYWVAGEIHNPPDVKGGRPAVVVSVPPTVDGRVEIVTRTTNLDQPGVPSLQGTYLKFSKPGVWGHLRSVEGHLWLEPDVRRLGQLDKVSLAEVIVKFHIKGPTS